VEGALKVLPDGLLKLLLKDLPEPVDEFWEPRYWLPVLPGWLNLLPFALRLKIEVAPTLAAGDANPREPVPPEVRVAAVPLVLVVGSTLREVWVFGSTK